MRFRFVSKLLSCLLGALAGALLLCIPIAWLLRDGPGEGTALWAFVTCAGITCAIAIALAWFGRGKVQDVLRKEAICVVGLGWLIASALSALPYALLMPEAGLADAFFESVSGLTTTGASVFKDVEALPQSLLFWRSMTQWLGGMGVIVFLVAILGSLGAGARFFYSGEASGNIADFEESRIQNAAFHLLIVYLILSCACTIAYHLAGLSWLDSLEHMFATVSTGGFGTRNGSFAAFMNPTLEWVAVVFMFLGGANFALLWRLGRGRFRGLRRHTELRAYVVILTLAILLIALDIRLDSDGESGSLTALRAAAFQAVSIMTTTGFTSANFDSWPVFAQVILLSLMFVGGCSGSTAGGIKVVRIAIALKAIWYGIEESFRKNIIRPVIVNDRAQNDDSVREVLVFIALSVVVLVAGLLCVALLEPDLTLVESLSAVLATFFCIGPGLGSLGPEGHYGMLASETKIVLALLMLMGRLEMFAILALFVPAFWRTFR